MDLLIFELYCGEGSQSQDFSQKRKLNSEILTSNTREPVGYSPGNHLHGNHMKNIWHCMMKTYGRITWYQWEFLENENIW